MQLYYTLFTHINVSHKYIYIYMSLNYIKYAGMTVCV